MCVRTLLRVQQSSSDRAGLWAIRGCVQFTVLGVAQHLSCRCCVPQGTGMLTCPAGGASATGTTSRTCPSAHGHTTMTGRSDTLFTPLQPVETS